MHEQICQLLRHTFGSQVELASYTIGNQRLDYLVLLATLQHPNLKVSIKLAGPHAPHVYSLDRAAMLHRLVQAQTTFPMPEIIAVDTSYKSWPWRYLIKTYIDGQEWASVHPQLSINELQVLYAHFGQTVAQIHAIRFPTFGELTNDGEVLSHTNVETALRSRAQSTIESVHLRQFFLGVLEKYKHVFIDFHTPALCHEDLHGHNILVHYRYREAQWRIATILDFDKAWAGSPEIDLARLELWTGMIGDGFWDAYKTTLPVDKAYEQRRPIYQLLWCLEYAQSTPKHLADTQQVCKALGLAPIVQFK